MKKKKKTKDSSSTGSMKRMLSFVKGYRALTLLCPVLIFADVLIELEIPKMMGEIVDMLYTIGGEGFSNAVLRNKLFEMLGLCFVTLIVGYFAARCSAIASMGFGANMRRELFNKTQDLTFENIDKLKISSLITRMTSDVASIQGVFKSTIVTFIKGPFMLIMALYYALSISRDLSVIFYFAVPGIIIALIILGYLAVPMFKKMLEKTDKFNGTLRGNINGIRVVKSFVREEHEKEKFNEANNAVMKMSIKAQTLILYLTPVITFILYGCMIFSLARGSSLIVHGNSELTTGQMTSFISYVSQVLTSLMTVLMVFLSMATSKASINRVNEVFNEEPAINDNDGNPELTVESGEIEFKDVSFKYNSEAVNNILENVNFKINSGEMIGIIGGTGSSKSTLIHLIPRLYDVTEGEVLVDGKNVKDYKFENLRNGISTVLQQNILFSGSVKDNIRWGNFDATDEEVISAAKDAQADSFISELENGYDTELGQGGNTVSGGQRQRLCIARSLLKKPKILIFDDCTSAVDTATDSKIRHCLRDKAYDSITKIIIAQRITSIMDADRIIVLENGKIEAIGTHDELVKSSNVYNEIFVSQQEGVLAQ